MRRGGGESLHELAGKPAPKEMLVDLTRLEREYYARKPDTGDPNQRVIFGTSGHRGSPLAGSFTEAHTSAITQAHLDTILTEARSIVDRAMRFSA